MSQALEKRVQELEKRLDRLTSQLLKTKPRKNDWRQTFGLSRNDEGFDEMVRLGREYRKAAGKKNNGARSSH